MSRAYSKKKKARRLALLQACPELKIVRRLIRSGKVPRWTRHRDKDGLPIMRHAGEGKVYLKPWAMFGTFQREAHKALYALLKKRQVAQ